MDSKYIQQAKNLCKENLTDDSIAYYLQEAGAEPAQIPAILERGKQLFQEERVAYYKVINKRNFYFAIAFTVVTIVLFFGIFPGMEMTVDYIRTFALIGSVLTCFFGYCIWLYNKTWKSPYIEEDWKVNLFTPTILLLFIPTWIFYYAFSSRYQLAQDNVLQATKLETTGHVSSGYSESARNLRGAGISRSTITIGFQTVTGDSVFVYQDVDKYEFTKYYIGQPVRLLYSKKNPHIFKLLMTENDIQSFKGPNP